MQCRLAVDSARSRARRALVGALALALVAQDLALAHAGHAYATRALPALVAVPVLAALAGGGRAALGLRLAPAEGWRAWLALALALGALGLVLGVLVVVTIDAALPRPFERAADFPRWAGVACLQAPLVEELVYRLALCAGVLALVGPRAALLASGAVFALLHVVYGNPSPENVLGGFVLAWAYLRSGSLAVPLLLHSLGNLGVGAFHLLVVPALA